MVLMSSNCPDRLLKTSEGMNIWQKMRARKRAASWRTLFLR
jgi:hypothetical protein